MKKLFILFILVCSFVFIPFARAEEELPLEEGTNEALYQEVMTEVVENALVPEEENEEEEVLVEFGISEKGYAAPYEEKYKELETQLISLNRSSRSSIFSSSEASSQLSIMILVIFASFALTSAAIYQFVLKKEI